MPADHEPILAHLQQSSVSLDSDQLDAFVEYVAECEDIMEELEAVEGRPRPPSRTYYEPTDDDDPFRAFLSRCSVSTSDSGVCDGMGIGVKDNIAVAGIPMTCGSPHLADYCPSRDATVVSRLLAEGARIVGKTNMDKFASSRADEPMPIREGKNPHDPERQPGGSSVGSAIAVAEGSVDAALGTDNGGSIRLPAAWTGVVGVKPTRGLVSQNGLFQGARTNDTIGPMAASSTAAARVLEAIAGPDSHDEYTIGVDAGRYLEAAEAGHATEGSEVTIGLPEEMFGHSGPIDSVVETALEQLAGSGYELRAVSLPNYEFGLPAWFTITRTEVGNFIRANANTYWSLLDVDEPLLSQLDSLKENPEELDETLLFAQLLAEYLNSRYGEKYYALAKRARTLVTEGIDEVFADVDVLASPTIPSVAKRVGEPIDVDTIRNTAPINVSGHPAISVPCGFHDELPVGVQFIAPHFEEERLFRTATDVERRVDADSANARCFER